MSDNLTVTIGADSSKLRAELALVNQATKAAQKQLAELAAAFNKTGTSADRVHLDAKARQLDAYKRSAASLKQEIAKLSPTFASVGKSAEVAASGLQEFVHQGRGLGRVLSEFSTLTRGVESFGGIFGKLAGGFGGGLAGVAIGKAFSELRDQINEVSKSLTELRDKAGQIGVKPIALQAAREVVTGIGEDAGLADKALQGMSDQLEAVRKKSTQPTGDASGVSVLRGGGTAATGGMIQLQGAVAQTVQILRGGTQAVKDFTKPLEAVGLDLSNIPVGKLGELQARLAQLQAFMQAAKTTLAHDPIGLDILSKSWFQGIPATAMIKLAPALLADTEAKIAALQNTSRGATDETLKKNEELIISQNRVKDAWTEAMSAMAASQRPLAIEWNNLITKLLDGTALKAFQATWREAWSEMVSQSNATWAAFLAGTQTAADGFKSIWQTTIDWLSNAISTVVSAAKSAASSVSSAVSSATSAAGDVGAGLFASGGMVRGAGSGTSDSILARLSNGEFVMNAASVRRLGSDFLASLNNPRFALGGLVGSLPQFANGGAVGGGSTVHLHLGGNSFALSGRESVVDALVVEANRQQMRSAGTKPSWFAARPSGR